LYLKKLQLSKLDEKNVNKQSSGIESVPGYTGDILHEDSYRENEYENSNKYKSYRNSKRHYTNTNYHEQPTYHKTEDIEQPEGKPIETKKKIILRKDTEKKEDSVTLIVPVSFNNLES
jgi:hypothetical protein